MKTPNPKSMLINQSCRALSARIRVDEKKIKFL